MSGRSVRRPLTLLSLLSAALVAVLTGTPGTAAAAPTTTTTALDYVALGDSFASGPLIPVQRTDPLGCLRSTKNYPSLVADRLDVASFTDVSCGGAQTPHLTEPQSVLFGSNPPQFDALTAGTDLVTLTIGGNDIGFGDIISTCGTASLTNPFGAPCTERYTADGVDQLRARIGQTAAKVSTALATIHQRAPHATVVLVGYLRILPPTGGCWPVLPVSAGDVPYLDGVQQALNRMLAEQAAANGALFVDPYQASLGHDVCQLPGVKWVEALLPTSLAAPVHPNLAGMHVVAELVTDALGGTPDRTALSE
ncbi:SGNH/GDSL hydrolase family protein [Goodfellowiella coeruleoviolacea]|uniref:GDSL-like Lipase/Acylhydrolase family protein n=1 Tax=Goodfellowiella coeruleoviolacea TaxID=334858 RepID=A0AAE3GIJ4_9PSEU|nr:SGNH/GDSL hydrolase family protein [Goodfellowiella coeruleoviolacea]MCP2168057.1 GDSL-like Lipase/Acylhydrolase family protein [Goodfellowiella coeruleoviolacea]